MELGPDDAAAAGANVLRLDDDEGAGAPRSKAIGLSSGRSGALDDPFATQVSCKTCCSPSLADCSWWFMLLEGCLRETGCFDMHTWAAAAAHGPPCHSCHNIHRAYHCCRPWYPTLPYGWAVLLCGACSLVRCSPAAGRILLYLSSGSGSWMKSSQWWLGLVVTSLKLRSMRWWVLGLHEEVLCCCCCHMCVLLLFALTLDNKPQLPDTGSMVA